jgi:glycosyltransferase involved in cell wall biosynthesis
VRAVSARVLFLDHSGALGGAELSLLDLATGFAGRSTVLLLADGPFRRRLCSAGVSVELLPTSPALHRVRRSGGGGIAAAPALVSAAWAVAARARTHDVLYANSQKAFMVAGLAAVLARRPLIYHLRDILSPEHFGPTNIRLAVWVANRVARRVVANSRATAEAFIRSGGSARKVRVVHNGIDPKPFDVVRAADAHAVRAELRVEDAPLIGVFGRFHPWKGQHVAVEVVGHLPGTHAIFVGSALFGEDAYVEAVRDQAAALGLADRIHFLGFREDVPRLMRAVDLVLHTSTAPEPFGRVLVEAMLAGRAVVASRGGGAVEIVEDGVTGVLVPPGDACEAARAVGALLSHPARRTAMGEAGRERARREFTVAAMWQAVAIQIDEVTRR